MASSLLILAALLLLSATAASALELPPGGTFTDDNGNIHEGNIEAIAADSITQGCNPPMNDRYCPEDRVTRGQMAAFLVRALDVPPTNLDSFGDDDGSVFEGDINRLAAAGITKGCNPPANDQFCPDSRVSRGQVAAFLVRAFGYEDAGAGDLFTDDDNSIFNEDIDRLGTAGITKGCNPPTNDRYCPGDPVLRDQMASFLARALGLTPIIPPPAPDVHAIGDSVMLGVTCNSYSCYSPSINLEGSIPSLDSNARVSRPFSEAASLVTSRLSLSPVPQVLVIHLGTNGPPTDSSFAAVMSAARNVDRVLFLTVKQSLTSNETTTNRVLRLNVPLYDNAELVDWFTVATDQLDMDAIDPTYGAHLWSNDARRTYVNLIKDAVANP